MIIDDAVAVVRISDLMALCLATAINTSMSAVSSDWFEELRTEDAKEHQSKRIFQYQASIYHCDFQALAKILRYRSCRDQVFGYYGFDISSGSSESHIRRSQVEKLLDRVIVDFRNRILAHRDANSVGSRMAGITDIRVYGEAEAIRDMVKLAEIFSEVCDANGKTYYSMIAEEREALLRSKQTFVYPLEQIIREERLNVSENSLEMLCRNIGIPIYNEAGRRFMESERYEADLMRIRDHLVMRNVYALEKKHRRGKLKKQLRLAACVLVLLVVAVWTLEAFVFAPDVQEMLNDLADRYNEAATEDSEQIMKTNRDVDDILGISDTQKCLHFRSNDDKHQLFCYHLFRQIDADKLQKSINRELPQKLTEILQNGDRSIVSAIVVAGLCEGKSMKNGEYLSPHFNTGLLKTARLNRSALPWDTNISFETGLEADLAQEYKSPALRQSLEAEYNVILPEYFSEFWSIGWLMMDGETSFADQTMWGVARENGADPANEKNVLLTVWVNSAEKSQSWLRFYGQKNDTEEVDAIQTEDGKPLEILISAGHVTVTQISVPLEYKDCLCAAVQ